MKNQKKDFLEEVLFLWKKGSRRIDSSMGTSAVRENLTGKFHISE
ncbi:hypothetical protein HMPREF1987_01938 [Peptostreptococcaceae bacterium oral taxon 113 str. W5053]|nr:hypothetical protein HMPREF1987_01938 [Peptostreptococcaceae bacterium oral taxon 113 str. W5053]